MSDSAGPLRVDVPIPEESSARVGEPAGPAVIGTGAGGAADRADPEALARAAARTLAETTGVARHDVAIVLGSGWASVADELSVTSVELRVTELPGFAPPGVAGHAGTVRSLAVGGRRVLVFLGRTHLYEGRGVDAVAHPVRVAAAAGCRIVILTNAAGGVRAGLGIGEPVLISDHLNLTFRSPLRGARFVDLTDLYSARLRALVRAADPSITEGVYAQFPGPQFETPAEVRMARALGADLVGMSTAIEAVAARDAGCEVLAISLVTNPAAGVSGAPLNHAEVLAAGQAAATRVGRLLATVIGQL